MQYWFMMKTLFALQFVLFLLFCSESPATSGSPDLEEEILPDSIWQRRVENNAFDVQEELTFLVRFGPVKAGTAVMSIPEIKELQSRKCYRAVTTIKSNSFMSGFFHVDDHIESLIDVRGIYSWYFDKKIREGKFVADRTAIFDHARGLVFEEQDTTKVPPFTQDVLSVFYYIRTQPLVVGQSFYVDNYADKKFYPLEVKVHKKEKVKVPAGRFNCIKIEPVMRGSGLFSQKGRLWVWLSDDTRRLIVKIKSKISVGYLTLELQRAKGVKDLP